MDGPGDGHLDDLGDGELDDLGDGQWSQTFPWLVRTGRSGKLRALLAQVEAAHRESATLMRGLGQEGEARQAEHFAAWVRLQLDEPEVARLLYPVAKDLRDVTELGLLLDRTLDAALPLLGADRGNVQILDPVTGSLWIVAARGFDAEFLDYFAVVDDDQSACGRAAAERTQTVITDVNTDPGFAPHREIAAAAGFRAVQSTPLTDRTGQLLGVLSTHYPRPYRPPDRNLRIMRRLGEFVGEIMTKHLSTSPDGPAGDPLGRAVASAFGCQPILANARAIANRKAPGWPRSTSSR